MLRARESRHVLQLARDETSSMRWLTLADSDSAAGSSSWQSAAESHHQGQDLETVHARFDFDSELLNSRAYQVASRANMIDALTGSRARKGISRSTRITSDPPGDTSTSIEPMNEPSGHGPPAPTGIALTTVVDVVSDAASDSPDDVSSAPSPHANAIPEAQAFSTSLAGTTRDSDIELPDYVIHQPESLGLLALQLGEPHSQPIALPNTSRIQILGGPRFKLSARLPLFFRPKKKERNTGEFFPTANIPPLPNNNNNNNNNNKPVWRVLILGISESGKTTLAKTMRAGYGDIDKAWLRLYRVTIFSNTILSLKWLLLMANNQMMIHDGKEAALLVPPPPPPPLELQKKKKNLWEHEEEEEEEVEAWFFATWARVIWELEVDHGFPRASSTLRNIATAAQFLWEHPFIRQVWQTASTAQRPITPGKHMDLPLYLPDCAEQ
jgi:hypothetical protein